MGDLFRVLIKQDPPPWQEWVDVDFIIIDSTFLSSTPPMTAPVRANEFFLQETTPPRQQNPVFLFELFGKESLTNLFEKEDDLLEKKINIILTSPENIPLLEVRIHDSFSWGNFFKLINKLEKNDQKCDFFLGSNIITIDRLSDREGLFVSLERPWFRGTEKITTLCCDQVFLAPQKKIPPQKLKEEGVYQLTGLEDVEKYFAQMKNYFDPA